MLYIKLLGFAAFVGGSLGLASAASAAPLSPPPADALAKAPIERVDYFCGPGRRLTPWGSCRTVWGYGYGYGGPRFYGGYGGWGHRHYGGWGHGGGWGHHHHHHGGWGGHRHGGWGHGGGHRHGGWGHGGGHHHHGGGHRH